LLGCAESAAGRAAGAGLGFGRRWRLTGSGETGAHNPAAQLISRGMRPSTKRSMACDGAAEGR